MDKFTGNGNDETFTAGVVDAKTGADITSINDGDEIDGGAGYDTLNITATAANNTSLTGLTVKGVEVVNITGSDFIDSSSTTTVTASNKAAVAQVVSLDISTTPSASAEVHTINFGDMQVDSLGTIAIGDVSESAVSAVVTTDSIAADASSSAIATAVAKALTADIVATTPKIAGLASATAVGNKVVVTYDLDDGSNGLLNPADGLLALTAPATGAATFGSTQVTTGIGSNGIDLITVEGATATAAITVTIDGTDYDAGDVSVGVSGTTANVLGSSATIKTAGEVAAKNAAVALVVDKLNEVAGGSLTASAGDENGELLITSDFAGVAQPPVSISQEATTLSSADADDFQAEANVVKALTTGAVAQQVTLTVDNLLEAETVDLFIGGASYGTLTVGSTDTDTTMAKALATAINGVLGDNTAVAIGEKVVVTAPTAGTPLPDITVDTAPSLTVASGTIGSDAANYIENKGLDATLTGGTGSYASSATIDADETATINAALAALDEVSEAQTRENAVISTTSSTTTYADASISAAKFAGSEQIWLMGDSNSTNVTGLTASQTLGLSGVTGAVNEATWGATVTAASLAVKASGGTLEVSGTKLDTLNVSGTGTAGKDGLAITEGTTAPVLATVNVSTSGSTYLDLSALTKLTAVTSTGEGGLALSANSGIESINSGEGNDAVTLSTATSKDNEGTTTDETLNASVSTGAGDDTIRVNTSGTGITTVDAGEGDDVVYYDAIGSGLNTIDLGAGDDTVYRGTTSSTTTINGGSGYDQLVREGASYTAASYINDNAVYSGFEAITFTSAVGAIDMSKLSIGDIDTITLLAGSESTNGLTEVSQAVSVTGRFEVDSDDVPAHGAVPTNNASAATGAAIAAAGYEVGTATTKTNFGGNLSVSVDAKAGDDVVLDLDASAATVTVAVGVPSADDTDVVPGTTVTGNLETLTIGLGSFQATGATAEKLAASALVAGLGKEFIADAIVNAGVTSGSSANLAQDGLNNLQSITIAGQGTVTIDAGSADPEVGAAAGASIAGTTSQLTALETIDVSGMVAMARLNYKGLEVTGSGYDDVSYGYLNLSTSDITLNANVAETVTLGGARDKVTTGATIAAIDTIIGFELAASASDADVVDTAKSDVLELGSFAYNSSTAKFEALEDNYATLNAGLTAAAAASNAFVVFHADGNTYAFIDLQTGSGSVAGLDDGDLLVELVGTLDLDLLVQEGVII